MRIVLIKIVRFLEDGLEPPLTYDEANKRLLSFFLSFFLIVMNLSSKNTSTLLYDICNASAQFALLASHCRQG